MPPHPMPTLYLTTPGTRAHLTSQHLKVELPADRSSGFSPLRHT